MKGLSQEALAKKIKGAQQDISYYESGRVRPWKERRKKIAKILCRSEKTLFPVKKKK